MADTTKEFGELLIDHLAANKPIQVVITVEQADDRFHARAAVEGDWTHPSLGDEAWVLVECYGSDYASAYSGAAAGAGELIARVNLGAALRR